MVTSVNGSGALGSQLAETITIMITSPPAAAPISHERDELLNLPSFVTLTCYPPPNTVEQVLAVLDWYSALRP